MSTLGDTMSTSWGYHEYTGVFSTLRDVMSASGMFSTSEGYHEYIRGIS